MKQINDLRRLLNLNFVEFTNRAAKAGPLEFPVLKCNTMRVPNYLALYQETGLYQVTEQTGLCFYSYDRVFDGPGGLFWAIYFNDEDRLMYFRKRFAGIKYVITPDISTFGNIQPIENYHRVWRSRVMALWFAFETDAVVIPNISYSSTHDLNVYFSGLEECTVIALSTKGHVHYRSERRLFINVVKYAVDHLPLKTIIAYSVCGRDENCLRLFEYAIEHGVQVFIPDNTLRTRNRLLYERRHKL